MGPLTKIKVIEIAHWLVAPYCTNMLSDLGAEVIKIEPPSGDQVRNSGSYFKNGESYLFAAYNHGKRSIVIDLKTPKGKRIALELCKEADVIIENYRPGTCDKLGVGYETVRKVNPRVVYCSISAFGDTPGYRHRPGMDPIVQGMGAVMSLTGEGDAENKPMLVGVPIADNSTAFMAFGAICAALYDRERTGVGQRVELNLIDTCVFNLSTRFGQYIATDQSPAPMGNQHAEVMPYQAFPTKDGWMMAGAQSDEAWQVFCRALGKEDLTEQADYRTSQSRLVNREVLSTLLNDVFRTKTTAEWEQVLSKHGVLHGPIWNVEQLLKSDLIKDHRLIVEVDHPTFGQLPVIRTPIRYSERQVKVQGPPPVLGEHTKEVLEQIGYTADEINVLLRNNIVRASEAGHCKGAVLP